MRLIGELPTETQANTFTAWLLTLSIDAHQDRAGDAVFEIWAKDEDQFESAVQELNAFRADPSAEKYRSAEKKAKKIQDEKFAKAKQHQKNLHRGIAQNKKGWFETAPLTMMLIVCSALVALFSDFGSAEKSERWHSRALQFVSVTEPSPELIASYLESPDNLDVRLASISRGELWRLISPIFVHYGAFHLIFNMLWLVQLGRMIEMRYGTLCLAMIVVFTAIFSNLLQGIVPMNVGGSAPGLSMSLMITRFGGMSGVVYGLFGFIWFRMLYDPNSRMNLSQLTIIIMVGYLFYCMIGPDSASVANWAHGGGIVMGMLLGLSPIGKRLKRRKI